MSSALQKNRLGHLLPGGFPELDNLFNHFLRAEEVAMWRAPASIWEADNTFHIEIDAPGVKKEDVELTFDKGALQITLERKAPEGERTNWHNERGYGKVSRSVAARDGRSQHDCGRAHQWCAARDDHQAARSAAEEDRRAGVVKVGPPSRGGL
ncbi:MAG: Hsp20/alpha crystallin family protein [Planctomycetes bacterium]|nr:Hsp20/alpha crystallin family protein [Planctomycetota bacterium]